MNWTKTKNDYDKEETEARKGVNAEEHKNEIREIEWKGWKLNCVSNNFIVEWNNTADERCFGFPGESNRIRNFVSRCRQPQPPQRLPHDDWLETRGTHCEVLSLPMAVTARRMHCCWEPILALTTSPARQHSRNRYFGHRKFDCEKRGKRAERQNWVIKVVNTWNMRQRLMLKSISRGVNRQMD